MEHQWFLFRSKTNDIKVTFFRIFCSIFLPEQFDGKFILVRLIINVLHHLDEPAIELFRTKERANVNQKTITGVC